MKIFIHYEPPVNYDGYQGARLRKTLKGACEANSITWVDSLYSFPDLIHIISPNDGYLIKEAKKNGYPSVVCCGYCEDDPKATFFTYKEGKRPYLNKKSVKTLNEADLVIVPNKEIESRIRYNGVVSKSKVIEPAVNLSRFDNLSDLEKNLARRYFGIREGEKYVLLVGNYNDQASFKAILEIADRCSDINFFIFGTKQKPLVLEETKGEKKKIKNVFILKLVEDDVYRSMLFNSSVYLLIDNGRPDCSSLYEAFASKVPVIRLGKMHSNVEIEDRHICFNCSSAEEVANKINEIIEKGDNKISVEAYNYVRQRDEVSLGNELKEIYTKILNKGR